tara:strand:+ start:105 stop:1259 length:1155 start_codon:yes stop_codon:yes gene_type:complete
MAQISFKDYFKYDYRVPLLVDKVYSQNDKSNQFATKFGLFKAEKLLIEGKEYKYSKNLYKRIEALQDEPGAVKLVTISGKIGKTKQDIQMNHVEKTAEFGGQEKGKKVNLGNLFEEELHAKMLECLNGKKCTGKYSEEANQILDTLQDINGPIDTNLDMPIVHEGGKNQPRPLIESAGGLAISPIEAEKHGEKLTDVTVHHINGKKSYLSLKMGSTVTFMNSGVAKNFFLESEMKTGRVQMKSGKSVLKTLGLDNKDFCKVFNMYNKTGAPMVENYIRNVKVPTQMNKFLETAIGSNYFMIHAKTGGIDFYHMSKSTNRSASKVSGDMTIYYGGKDGKGKRIDIHFSNQHFDFKLNIRNKQAGVYPSHMMLDYTTKNIPGKITL